MDGLLLGMDNRFFRWLGYTLYSETKAEKKGIERDFEETLSNISPCISVCYTLQRAF